MNWDTVEGSWMQLKGSLKESWGKLTDDDLEMIAGKRDQFVGRIQTRYGIAKEDAERRADEWVKTLFVEDDHESAKTGQTPTRASKNL